MLPEPVDNPLPVENVTTRESGCGPSRRNLGAET